MRRSYIRHVQDECLREILDLLLDQIEDLEIEVKKLKKWKADATLKRKATK